MKRIENAFVRWFNRRHKRDGSLFRGRFTSRHVDSATYRWNVFRYIDQNPVSAGLVDRAEAYPYGSARFRRPGGVPLWFSAGDRRWEEAPGRHAQWVIERRLEKPTAYDPLDDLVGSAPARVHQWMKRKARLADGSRPGSCLVSPEALRLGIADVRERYGEWLVSPRSRAKDGWPVLESGMCRDVVGLSTNEASILLGVGRSSAGHAVWEHRRLLLSDSIYGNRAAEVLQRSLELTYGRDERARLDKAVDRA